MHHLQGTGAYMQHRFHSLIQSSGSSYPQVLASGLRLHPPPPLTLSERLDQVQVATDPVMQQTSTVQGLSLVRASPSSWSQLPPFSAHRCSGRLPATVQIHWGPPGSGSSRGLCPSPVCSCGGLHAAGKMGVLLGDTP